MHFNDMARLLATECGMTALPGDSEGAVAVAFGQLVVNIRPAAAHVAIRLDARLGVVAAMRPETMIAMMADNRWPRESFAGVLGVDAAGTVFLLHLLSTQHLSFERFRSVLGRFATLGTRWRERLAQAEATADQTPVPTPGTLQALA